MKVYKFGGASVKDAAGVRNLRDIVLGESNLFIIVSAMGKTTNALEGVFEAMQQGNQALALERIDGSYAYHRAIIDELMGADITIDGHHAIVRGVHELQGAEVSSTDLRAGGALVLAGLVAEGYTRVHEIAHIDRGYEDYVGKLSQLGATISRVTLGQ